MKKILFALPIIALLSSCATGLPSAGPGFLMTHVTEGISASPKVKTEKTGKACAINILGLVSIGESSIKEAAKKSSIINIGTVDRSIFSILGVYAHACTIVSGE